MKLTLGNYTEFPSLTKKVDPNTLWNVKKPQVNYRK